MDREYAISFMGRNGLDEISVGTVKAKAIKDAKWYIKRGATQMVLKYYQDGDLLHQWDWIDGKWKQYE